MSRGSGRVAVDGSGIPGGEVFGWLLLTVFAFGCIIVGAWVNKSSGRTSVWSIIPPNENVEVAFEPGRVLRLDVIPYWWTLTVPVKEPWQLTPADLTNERILYNLLTKAGYRWLILQVGLVLGVGVAASMALTWLYQSRLQAIGRIQAKELELVELSGSVEVRHRQGIIYWARQVGLGPVADTFEEFGSWLSGIKSGRVVKSK